LLKSLSIDGCWISVPDIKQDSRGCFLEWYRRADFHEALGHDLGIAQASCSISRRGVVRGIHFASVPPGQAKHITCVGGAVLDVIVDLRVGSPTFGEWTSVCMNEDNRLAVFIEEGLGHGFMALSEYATMIYLASSPYTPGAEHGICPADPDLGICWPLRSHVIMSDRDAAAQTLAEAQRSGILPDYITCQNRKEMRRNGRFGTAVPS
jgi:dTDP-4-dehydrorhamnose 3,5-epimerase